MRDDINKLPLPKSAKKYARMTSKDLGSNWSKKVDMYMDMAADLTNQSKEGFKNKDASGKVKHAFKEGLMGPEDIEQMSSDVEITHRATQFLETFESYFHGSDNLDPIEAWMDVFRVAANSGGIFSGKGEPWGEAEFVNDRGLHAAEGKVSLDAAWADVVNSPGFKDQLPGPYDVEAAKRLFYVVYGGGKDAQIWDWMSDGSEEPNFDPMAESIVKSLLGENDDMLKQMGDIADTPLKQYQRAREALNWVFGEGEGQVAAIDAALQSCGFVGDDGPIYVQGDETLADVIWMYLDDISSGNSVDEACDAIQKTLEEQAERLGIANGSVWALMKIFREEAQGIADTAEEYNREMDYEIGAGEEDPDEVIQTTDRVVEESIKAAAVKCHDGTVIAGPPGADHIACCMMANRQGKSWDDEGLGFVTHDDRFVDRNEAEIEGLKHGQLRPEISDPGMVHARDFYWNESRGGYRYETNCVNGDENDITDMVDTATDVTYEEFMRNVPLDQIFASGIGYGYDWPTAKLIVAGIDPREVGRQGLTLKKDWHVTYHKSTYQGRPCYFMCHSAIEYVFVKD